MPKYRRVVPAIALAGISLGAQQRGLGQPPPAREVTVTAIPGDSLIPDCIGQLTHAITIQRSRHDVWPWLVQMAASPRAGWYSYDRLDNAGTPSARTILPSLQHVVVGTLFPALPGRREGLTPDRLRRGSPFISVA